MSHIGRKIASATKSTMPPSAMMSAGSMSDESARIFRSASALKWADTFNRTFDA